MSDWTPWTLIPTAKAAKDADPLPRDVRERIARALDRWATTGHGDLAPLQNVPGATHRLRVGRTWRVALALDEGARAATVLRVLPRGSEYRR